MQIQSVTELYTVLKLHHPLNYAAQDLLQFSICFVTGLFIKNVYSCSAQIMLNNIHLVSSHISKFEWLGEHLINLNTIYRLYK